MHHTVMCYTSAVEAPQKPSRVSKSCVSATGQMTDDSDITLSGHMPQPPPKVNHYPFALPSPMIAHRTLRGRQSCLLNIYFGR